MTLNDIFSFFFQIFFAIRNFTSFSRLIQYRVKKFLLLFFPSTVEPLREDDDDFFMNLGMAIGSEKQTPKLNELNDPEKEEKQPNGTVENGLMKKATEEPKESEKESPILNGTSPKNGSDKGLELDSEELENELLKDLDDDNNEVLYEVSKEVEDLVDSVIDITDEEKPKELSSQASSESEDKLLKSSSDEESEENDKLKKLPVVEKEVKELQKDKVSSDKVIDNQKLLQTSIEDDLVSTECKEDNQKADNLLVVCASPKRTASTEEQISSQVSSEVSSVSGDAQINEDSSDNEKPTLKINVSGEDEKNDPTEIEEQKKEETQGEGDKMETDDVIAADGSSIQMELISSAGVVETSSVLEKEEDEEMHLCIVQGSESPTSTSPQLYLCMVQESESPIATSPPLPEKVVKPAKPNAPFEFRFMRKFSSAVGELSRPELEELLITKITESVMFCSETTELRGTVKKLEESLDILKKRFENVQKQYHDLEMIHNRVMKDLRDRPGAPITPVKITRAVGLQVYQPVQRSKHASTTITLGKPSNKRPMEKEAPVNGNQPVTPENAKRKKTLKTTPMRPPLSDKERASLEMQEAREQQNLRTNVSMSLSAGGLKVSIHPNVTMTQVSTNGFGLKRSQAATDTSQSQVIDLSDEEADDSNGAPVAKVAPYQLPPALVAIKGPPSRTIITPKAQQQQRLPQFRCKL